MGKKGGLGAIVGGVAGSFFGPAGASLGAGLGASLGGAGDAADANRALARSAGSAAAAQQRAAQQFYNQRAPQVQNLTTAGLASFDKALAAQDKNLARQEELVAQIDPTILEASQQALKLLRGEQASILGPAKQQRDMQRNKLLASLREQLGPGAETSTAGIQAINRFDAETNQLLAGHQQSALSQLGGIAGQFSSIRPDMLRQAQGFGDLASGRANLGFAGEDQLGKLYAPIMGSAGSQFVGDQIRAQGRMAQANQMQSLGGQLLGAGLTSGLSGGFKNPFGGGAAPAAPQVVSGGSYKDFGNYA